MGAARSHQRAKIVNGCRRCGLTPLRFCPHGEHRYRCKDTAKSHQGNGDGHRRLKRLNLGSSHARRLVVHNVDGRIAQVLLLPVTGVHYEARGVFLTGRLFGQTGVANVDDGADGTVDMEDSCEHDGQSVDDDDDGEPQVRRIINSTRPSTSAPAPRCAATSAPI